MNKSPLTPFAKLLIVVVLLSAVGFGVYFFKKKNVDTNSGNSTETKNVDYSDKIQLNGLIGSEKANFFDNPEIIAYLQEKYGISIKYSKVGSLEMLESGLSGANYDFYFLSSQTALEILKQKAPEKIVKSELIFNSPLVFYSWNIIDDKLSKAGLVKKVGNTSYFTDLAKMVNMIETGKKWQDLGITELYGKINILSTDPNKSSSGAMFAGLLANIIANDEVTQSNIDVILPKLKAIYAKLGYMENSSGNLFEQYLKMGVGAYPIIVGYENQMIEFAEKYKDIWATTRQKALIIYPEPTLWTSHPLVVSTDKALRLIDALKDPKIQEIAWKSHGFRSGIVGINNDISKINIQGIPVSITKVIQVPSLDMVHRILDFLRN